MIKGFNIYRNGILVDVIYSRSLKSAKNWIRKHIVSSHMFAWKKTGFGYRYDTTIGVYIEFNRAEIQDSFKLNTTVNPNI